MKKRLVQLAQKLLSVLPSKLPTSLAEFDAFCTSIFALYDLPDYPSYRSAIATIIMHLGPTTLYKPKRFFALSVKKSQANQIAFHVMQDINAKEKAAEKAELAKELAVSSVPAQG